MPNAFFDLRLNRIAVHEIFKRDVDLQPIPPRCSDTLANLDAEGKSAIRERIIGALGSNSKSVQMSVVDDGPGTAFDLFSRLPFVDDATFLDVSQQIAQKLTSAQTARTIPGGVLVVVDGQVGADARPFSGVIKAEVHSGFIKEAGDQGPLIRYLTDLLLTPNQRFHKIGVFVREPVQASPPDDYFSDDYSVYVFDNQMNGAEITTAANYFYERFLGCTAASTAKKLTRDFYKHSRDFIDASPLGDESKVESVSALHVYLRSNTQTIQALEFAEQHLPPEFHQPYMDFLVEHEFPENAVPKDTSQIKHKLRIRKLNFSTQVKITAPADRFRDLVQVQRSDDNVTIVRIVGQLLTQD
jgi:hypothetical protein